jgi:threonine dehydrogenase-like Zn-dependent dehydrogenase
VIVLGDGRLGLLCALVLAQTGCDLTVLGRHAAKLALLDGAGIHTQVATPAVLAQLATATADVIVEATGAKSGFATALQLVRPGGVVALKSTFADHLDNFDLSHLVVDEITLVGSRCGPFAPALAALASGQIDPRPLIHAEYSLDDAAAAIARAGESGVLKVLIRP